MTPYEQGFMAKCAEYGVDGRSLLEKNAQYSSILGSAVAGAKGGLAELMRNGVSLKKLFGNVARHPVQAFGALRKNNPFSGKLGLVRRMRTPNGWRQYEAMNSALGKGYDLVSALGAI